MPNLLPCVAIQHQGWLNFIAMNWFKVPKGSEQAFEELWLSRETHLDGNPGFVVSHLLEGPAREDHVLYSSHTIWESQGAFEA